MAWTYGANPEGDTTDSVRFMVGDTDTTDQLVQDGEIDYLLTLYPPADGKSPWLAAAATAEAIAAKFARKMDRSIGSLQASAEQQYNHYVALAAQLRMNYWTNGTGQEGLTGFRGIKLGIPQLGGGGKTQLSGM